VWSTIDQARDDAGDVNPSGAGDHDPIGGWDLIAVGATPRDARCPVAGRTHADTAAEFTPARAHPNAVVTGAAGRASRSVSGRHLRRSEQSVGLQLLWRPTDLLATGDLLQLLQLRRRLLEWQWLHRSVHRRQIQQGWRRRKRVRAPRWCVTTTLFDWPVNCASAAWSAIALLGSSGSTRDRFCL
jgi:hypothetical protein